MVMEEAGSYTPDFISFTSCQHQTSNVHLNVQSGWREQLECDLPPELPIVLCGRCVVGDKSGPALWVINLHKAGPWLPHSTARSTRSSYIRGLLYTCQVNCLHNV